MTGTSVAVVICCHDPARLAFTYASIDTALAGLLPPDGVIVVVDGSSTVHAALVARYRQTASCDIIMNVRAPGLAGARNTGVGRASQDVVLFVDDDAELRSGWREALEARFAVPSAGIVGGAVHPRLERARSHCIPDDFFWVIGCDYEGLSPDGVTIRNPIGACMAIRSSVFREVGLFDETLGRVRANAAGGEETEFAMRVRRIAPEFSIVRDAALAVDHFVPVERTRLPYLVRRCFQEGRSKALLAAKFDSGDSLAREYAHVWSVVVPGIGRDLGRGARGDASALCRASTRVAGLAAAASGRFAVSRRERMRSRLSGVQGASKAATIVICTLGREAGLAATVRAALDQQFAGFEVVVVDNDPAGGGVREALRHFDDPRIRLVEESRRGLSFARNTGVAAARADIIAFTDDDAVPHPDWLQTLTKGFDSPDVACVTGRVVPASTKRDVERWFEATSSFDRGASALEWRACGAVSDGYSEGPTGPVFPIAGSEFGSGNNMAFRRSFLAAARGFDTALGAGSPARGGEDLDMFRTAALAGATVRYRPDAIVVHRHRSSEAALKRQMFAYGSGMAASVTRLAAVRPAWFGRILGALPVAAQILLDSDSTRNVKKPATYPAALQRAELRGYLSGPALYVISVCRARYLEQFGRRRIR